MSAFVIKLIAMITMLIDHIGFVFEEPLAAIHPALPLVFRGIGRLAFPLFAFGIAEGVTHTSNPVKYLVRMFIFMLIAQLPFMLMVGTHYMSFTLNLFNREVPLCLEGSVMVTLFLGLVICTCIHEGRHFGAALALAAAYLLDKLLGFDYGLLGVLFVAALYFARGTKAGRLLVMVLFAACFYLSPISAYVKQVFTGGFAAPPQQIWKFAAMCVPGLLLLFYNGQPGPKLKYATYVFYPLHMFVLWAIWASVNIYN